MSLTDMPNGILIDNFRSLCQGVGANRSNPVEQARMNREADQYAQEILRRMAW